MSDQQHWFHVDAFATSPFTGNPAAVLVLTSEPDDATARRLGGELNQPATAVVWPTGAAGRFGLRWFTATGELELCGHGTLAATRVLLDLGLDAYGVLHFDTRSGPLIGERDDHGQVRLRLPTLTPEPLPDQGLARALTGALGEPAATVMRNRLDALLVLPDAAAVRRAAPDLAALSRLPIRGMIVTASADEPGVDFVSRFFSPALGVDEDAVTGSAHCALAPYWIAALDRQPLLGHQVSARGGHVRVALDGADVVLSGSALVLGRGSWTVAAAARGPA